MNISSLPVSLRCQFRLAQIIMGANWYMAIGILATACSVAVGNTGLAIVMCSAVAIMLVRVAARQLAVEHDAYRAQLISIWLRLEYMAILAALAAACFLVPGWSGTILIWTMVVTIIISSRLRSWTTRIRHQALDLLIEQQRSS